MCSHQNNNIDDKALNMELALRRLGQFLEPALTFLNCHFADYYLKSYWNNYIPCKIRQDLESKSLEQVISCVTDLAKNRWKDYPENSSPNEDLLDFKNVSSLQELVVSIGKIRLSEQNLSTDHKRLRENREKLKDQYPKLFVDLEFDNFMSSKKMHEVLHFSEFIAFACEGQSLSSCKTPEEKSKTFETNYMGHIVDVGSGKGYLSSFLTLYYDLKVLAIDASAGNTEGCEKRSAKLDKTWPQLVRRAKERRDTGTATHLGKSWRKKLTKMGISPEEYRESIAKDLKRTEGNLKSVTEMITTKTDLQQLVDRNFQAETLREEGQSEIGTGKDIEYGIVGLHTCGNLGANILKLFIYNERAKFICVVPCCYNLVREDETLFPETVYYGSKFGLSEEDKALPKTGNVPRPDEAIGFPLSKVLQNYKTDRPFVIGRNARMLSAYSLPRLVSSEECFSMPPVLYYRALLQVLLKHHKLLPDNHDDTEGDLRVGRMTKKCSNFRDYATFALKKLGITSEKILNDGSIEEIESTYASPEMLDKFQKYYLLRILFASVVEDLILLDRLIFLLEQDSIADAHIVQLFDPSLSPRSHAIVAFKK